MYQTTQTILGKKLAICKVCQIFRNMYALRESSLEKNLCVIELAIIMIHTVKKFLA